MSIAAGSPPRDENVAVSSNPFKLLDPYTKKDRLFGRDGDVVLVVARIASARTTLLFSGTGIGKTSFLQAKLIPHLDRDYQIVLFSRWTGDRPATDLRLAILAQLGLTDVRGWSARKRIREALGKPSKDRAVVAQDPAAPFADEEPIAKPVLLVLDQFEELFQRGGSDRRAKKCAGLIAWLVRKFPVRVVIAMREEYLGELSVFDNRLADLFDNHYRLKRPTKSEAGSIIRQTAGIRHAPVAADRLDELVKDLSRLRPTLGSKTDNVGVPTEFVSPPFLQISCYRMWEAEQPTAERPFLSTYERGRAAQELEAFCGDQLRRLGFWRRHVVSRCFEFLVDRRGAKVAYDSTLLARLIRLPVGIVRKALDRLTETRTRILRRRQVNGSSWYELYHDVYAPVVQQWSDRHRWWRQRVVLPLAFAVCILTTYLVFVELHDRNLVAQLRSDSTSYAAAVSARAELEDSRLIGLTRTLFGSPNLLWARYVDGQAKNAQKDENRRQALLLLAEAAAHSAKGSAEWNRYSHEFGLIAPESVAALVSSYYSEETLPRDQWQFVINAAGLKAAEVNGKSNHEVIVHLLDGRLVLWHVESGSYNDLSFDWKSVLPKPQPLGASVSRGCPVASVGAAPGIRNSSVEPKSDYRSTEIRNDGSLESPWIRAFVTAESNRFFAGVSRLDECTVLVWGDQGNVLVMDSAVVDGLSGKSRPAVAFSNPVSGSDQTRNGPLLGVFWSQDRMLRTFAIEKKNKVNVLSFAKHPDGLPGISSWTFVGNDKLAAIDAQERSLRVFASTIEGTSRFWSEVCQIPLSDASVEQSRVFASGDGRVVAAFIQSSDPEMILWNVDCQERSRMFVRFAVTGVSGGESRMYAVSPSPDGFADIIDLTERKSLGRIRFADDVVLPDEPRMIRFGEDTATVAEAVNMLPMVRPGILARAEEADVEVLGQLDREHHAFSLLVRRDGGPPALMATLDPRAQSLQWSMTSSGRFLVGRGGGCLNIWETTQSEKPPSSDSPASPQANQISADAFLVDSSERSLLAWPTQLPGCPPGPGNPEPVGGQISTSAVSLYPLDTGRPGPQTHTELRNSVGLKDPVFSKDGQRIAGIVGNRLLAWELPSIGRGQTPTPIAEIVVSDWNMLSSAPLFAWTQSDVLVVAKKTSLEWHRFEPAQRIIDTQQPCQNGEIQLLGSSRNDSRLAVACSDRKIEIWDQGKSTSPIRTELTTKPTALLLSADGNNLLVQTKNWVHMFRRKTPTEQFDYLLGRPISEGVRVVARKGVYGFVDAGGIFLGELENVPHEKAIREILNGDTINVKLGQSLAGDGKPSAYKPR